MDDVKGAAALAFDTTVQPRRVAMRPKSNATRRGVLIDVDGPLLLGGGAVAGSADVLRLLSARDIPWVLLSNSTRVTARQLADELRACGFVVDDAQVVTVADLVVDHLAAVHPGAPVLYLGEGRPFADCALVALVPDAADADVVLVGGNGPSVTFGRVNHALAQVRRGAALVALHRNVTWAQADGLALDIGPILAGLEQASGVRATVVGKPAATAFRLAAARAGIAVEGSVMVGDDIRNDVLAAQELGMTGVLTLTGKTSRADLARTAVEPDLVVDSLADLPRQFPRLSLQAQR